MLLRVLSILAVAFLSKQTVEWHSLQLSKTYRTLSGSARGTSSSWACRSSLRSTWKLEREMNSAAQTRTEKQCRMILRCSVRSSFDGDVIDVPYGALVLGILTQDNFGNLWRMKKTRLTTIKSIRLTFPTSCSLKSNSRVFSLSNEAFLFALVVSFKGIFFVCPFEPIIVTYNRLPSPSSCCFPVRRRSL